MKKLIFLTLIISSCGLFHNQSRLSNRLVHVDTTKPYKVVGAYTIKKLTFKKKNFNDSLTFCFNIYDRISGKVTHDGVVWFIGKKEFKVFIVEGRAQLTVPYDSYLVDISSISNTGYRIADLHLNASSKIEIDVFLGKSLQF